MLIFDYKQLLSPDELSRLADIDLELIRRAIGEGCPTAEGRISFDVYSRWLTEHFRQILPEFDLASCPTDGWFSESDQYWILRPVLEWQLHTDPMWIDIGGPGCDGISWAVRKNYSGVWAYYPIDDEFVLKAGNASELIQSWERDSISV